MKQKLIQMLESNGTLTLREMSSAMMREFGIRVTPQCIAYNLNGMCFTLKTVREEPTAMNSEANIEKRKVFCQKLREAKRSENIIVYLDETNFNIHCSRKKAWAKKGERAIVKVHSTKAPNINVLCAVSSYIRGCVNFKTIRGSVTSQVFAKFVNDTIQEIVNLINGEENPPKITLVIDNAPAHSGVENLIEPVFATQAEILRLGPYSPQLNPIEGCFSSFKSEVKKLISQRRSEFDQRGAHPTLTEKRFRILEEAAMKSKDIITLRLVYNQERHCEAAVQAAFNGEPMTMGQ